MAEKAKNLIPGLEAAIEMSAASIQELRADTSINERQRRPMLSAIEQFDAKLRGALAKERMPKPRRKGGAA